MSFTAIKMRILPALADIDIELIKGQVGALVEKHHVKHFNFSEENIAFGLKAVILTFEWPENKELEPFEEEVRAIDIISSADIIDMRRTIG